jgi:glycosyltransferase involved in cell wall biosynthesis
MRSGKPVLCYKLEGIPEDYDPYLSYIDEEGGIQAAVREIFALSPEKRREMGEMARNYVLSEKNAKLQCGRLAKFLRGLL